MEHETHLRLTKDIKHLIHIVHGRICLHQGSDGLIRALDRLGDTVDILGLDDSLEVIFKDLGEVVCALSVPERDRTGDGLLTLKFRTTEILDDILPIGRVIISTQVGLQLAAQNFECGTLPNTVGAYKT